MDEPWTANMLAEELMKVFPTMGRLMALYMRDKGEEESSMMQVGVLFELQHGPITASDIAKKRRVSLQAASVLVQGLVERGWVTRSPHPTDRRQLLLEITPEGIEHARSRRQLIADYLTDFLQGLSEEEIAAGRIFLPALGKLVAAKFELETLKNEKQESSPEEQTNL